MNRRVAAALAVLGLGTFLADFRVPAARAHEPELSRYTYHREVRPLLERHCASCHSGVGPAPVNLMRYAEAVSWANAIARQVLHRRMPPWLPDDGVGDLAHARTLDDRETDLLVDWAIGLAPEGPRPGGEAPAPGPPAKTPGAVRAWPSSPIEISEDLSELAVCVPLVIDPEASVAGAGGFELRPGEAVSILRRAVLFRGGCEGDPVFTWVVGQGTRRRPPGSFDPLGSEGELFLALEYRKGFETEGLAFEDRPEVGILPAPENADFPIAVLRAESGVLRPGAGALLALLPPREIDPARPVFSAELVGPDGSVETLLRIRRTDPDWLEKYAFRAPVRMGAGSEIRFSHPGAVVDVIREGSAPAE